MGIPLWVPKASAGSPAHKQVRDSPWYKQREWGSLILARAQTEPRLPSPRLPSDWLSLDKSVFQLVAQTVGVRREPEPRDSLQEPHSPALPSKPPW